jgi:hypothetical protein
MIVKSDPEAKSLKIDPVTSLVRVDGVILCKRVVRCGQVVLQFKDGDRMRSQCRGTAFIEVPLESFRSVLTTEQMDILKWPYE